MRTGVQFGGLVAASLLFVWEISAQIPIDHPPLPEEEGNIDYTVCALCHEDKKTGNVVHPAVEIGCESCHEVEQEEDDSSAILRLTTKGNELCFTCHSDQQPAPTNLTVHMPVRTGSCLTCHDPHTSENASLLRLPAASREADENLCLGCHKGIAAQVAKPTEHMAIDMGCATCHTTHKSEPADRHEGVFHLNQSQPELCANCHDVEDIDLKKTHFDQPFDTARCSRCHNPHGSEREKLINTFAHLPFEMKQCEICHSAPIAGKVSVNEDGSRQLCYMCHDDIRTHIEEAKVPHGLFQQKDTCTDCHSPHASAYPHQLRRKTVALCESCHQERRAEHLTKKFLHPPVFEMSCTVCHDAHGSENPNRLRASINETCLECHGVNPPKSNDDGTITIFGNVQVPAETFKGIRKIGIAEETMRGHPLAGHPISGPNSLLPGKPAITCVTCHNPHASDFSRRRFQLKEGMKSVCLNCH